MNSKGFERNIHGELKREIRAKGFPYLTQMNFGRDAKEMGVIQEGLEGNATDLSTLNKTLKNSSKHLQAILYECNNLFINCPQFDLATTCFTHWLKIFKKFIFLASPKTWFVTVHPPYKNLIPEIKVLLSR